MKFNFKLNTLLNIFLVISIIAWIHSWYLVLPMIPHMNEMSTDGGLENYYYMTLFISSILAPATAITLIKERTMILRIFS